MSFDASKRIYFSLFVFGFVIGSPVIGMVLAYVYLAFDFAVLRGLRRSAAG